MHDDLLARALSEGVFTAAYLETVAAVDRLDVEDLASRDSQNALHRRGHVLVHAIGELDDDDRALAWRPHQPARYSTSTIRERVLRAGEQVTLVALPRAELPPDLPARLGRIGIEVCYASVYGDIWKLTSRGLGGVSEWTEGGQCPRQDGPSPAF